MNLDSIIAFFTSKQFISPIVIVVCAMVIYKIVIKIIDKLFNIHVKDIDPKRQKTIEGLIKNMVKYFIIIISIMMILDVFGMNTSAIIASLGIAGLVIGLALQDTIKDFVSGMFIIFDDQYRVGDEVTISGFTGRVINLGLKTTKIKSYTGEVKIVSNRNIAEVVNHSLENAVAIIDVPFEGDVNLEKIEKVMNEICEDVKAEMKTSVLSTKVIGINKISLTGFDYRIVFTTRPMKKSEVERLVMTKIKERLKEEDFS